MSYFMTMVFGLSSCNKHEKPGSGKIEFTFAGSNLQSAVKAAKTNGTATYVVITIENGNGEIVSNSEKLELYNMGGYFISQPLSILTGTYRLTRFLVLDADNSVLYASPVKGSDKAFLVENPLPLAFSAEDDKTTKLVPEVLDATGTIPASFGYTTFSYNVVGTFDFLIGTFIYNESLANFEMIPSDISIYSDSVLVYSGHLKSQTTSTHISVYDSLGVTNKITLPERFNNYTLVVSKPGFETYTKTFTKEELKLHYQKIDKGPLVVVLTPKQQDYYIRGDFGGEYMNYLPLESSDENGFYSMFKDSLFHFGVLILNGYENSSLNSRNISMSLVTHLLTFDDMVVPFTIPTEDKRIIYADIQVINGVFDAPFTTIDTVNYMGISSKGEVTITIESKADDIITGKFSGDLGSDDGVKRLKVTNGEFRCKISRFKVYNNYKSQVLN